MTRQEFEQLVAEEFGEAVPEKFRHLIQNVAFLVENEPSIELRRLEGLGPDETLLGHYRGVPTTARGDHYGVGATLPDTITLFQLPIEEAAEEILRSDLNSGPPKVRPLKPKEAVRQVIRETIWHEVAHHFGYDEDQVRKKEDERKI